MRKYRCARVAAACAQVLALSAPLAAQSVNDPIMTTDVPASAPAVTAAASMPVEPAPAVPCAARVFASGKDKSGALYVSCAGESLRIGPSTGFAAAWSSTLGRYLVANRTEDGERVYMIRPKTERTPALVEDLTNDLAAAARGLKLIQVRALEGGVDIASFASSGAVKLAGAAPGMPVKSGSQPVAVRIVNEGGMVRVVNPPLVSEVSSTPATPSPAGN